MGGCIMGGCVSLFFFKPQKREINDKGRMDCARRDVTYRGGGVLVIIRYES